MYIQYTSVWLPNCLVNLGAVTISYYFRSWFTSTKEFLPTVCAARASKFFTVFGFVFPNNPITIFPTALFPILMLRYALLVTIVSESALTWSVLMKQTAKTTKRIILNWIAGTLMAAAGRKLKTTRTFTVDNRLHDKRSLYGLKFTATYARLADQWPSVPGFVSAVCNDVIETVLFCV